MLIDNGLVKAGDVNPYAQETIVLAVDSVGNSETDTLFDSYVPGYAFEVVGVQHFAEAVTAAASYDLKIATTTALTAAEVPTAATREDGALSATKASLRGTAAEALNLHATTDGSGLLTGLKVKVRIRPQGQRG